MTIRINQLTHRVIVRYYPEHVAAYTDGGDFLCAADTREELEHELQSFC